MMAKKVTSAKVATALKVIQDSRIVSLILFSIVCYSVCSCKKYSPDEPPQFSIYKTKGNYIEYVNLNFKKDSTLKYTFGITEASSIKYTYRGITGYSFRIPLSNGYILQSVITSDDSFTNISIQEYLEIYKNYPNGGKFFSICSSRVIDNNPFTEFYLVNSAEVFNGHSIEDFPEINPSEAFFRIMVEASSKINKVIDNNLLDSAYTRIK